MNCYDIFDTTGTDHWRLMDGVAGDAVEIAHAVGRANRFRSSQA